MNGRVESIPPRIAWEFLSNKHYAGRKPQISIAFGWFFENELYAVCTFGKPASPQLCRGICGDKWKPNVYELNRLCRTENSHHQLSEFVAECLRELKDNDWIIVSYSDTAMCHNGYIYQALNFYYTGCTKERTDKYVPNGKHPRHYKEEQQHGIRVIRSAKNRYVYFATHSKKLKKEWLRDMEYPILPYPKEKNQNYTLGNFIKPIIVNQNGELLIPEAEEGHQNDDKDT